MGKVTGKACSLDFICDLEGETLSALAPRSRVAGVVPVEQECGGERLQERSEMHRRRGLAHAAFVAGDSDNHASSLLYFCMYENLSIQTVKNTEIRRGTQGYETQSDSGALKFLIGSGLEQ